MLLLSLILLFPFLVLAAIGVATCIAWSRAVREQATRQAVSAREVRRPRVAQPFSAIRVADAFDPETCILWDTQAELLEVIYSAGPWGIHPEALLPFYVRSAHSYPELYEGSTFGGWLKFLESTQLILWRGQMVALTDSGIKFLKCRSSSVTAAARTF